MSRRVYIALVVALGVTILVAGTALVVVLRDRGRPSPAALLRPTGIPAAVTTLEANLMDVKRRPQFLGEDGQRASEGVEPRCRKRIDPSFPPRR